MRKFFSLYSFVFIFFLAACGAGDVKTPNPYPLYDHQSIQKVNSKTYAALEAPYLNAKSAYVMNVDTGDVLLDVNSNESLPVASMSKIMTELLVLEAIENGEIDWDTTVPISDYAYTISNTLGIDGIAFDANETYAVKELFEAMAIRSSNAASIALAELVAGSEKDFVGLMNEKAISLGLTDSQFVNSTGLTNHSIMDFNPVGELDESNHMSAQDVVQLAHYLIHEYPELLDITSKPFVDFHGTAYHSTNLMLSDHNNGRDDFTFPNVDGFKTGFTNEAGYCFVGTTVINDVRFISVIIGAESVEDRFHLTKSIYQEIRHQNNE